MWFVIFSVYFILSSELQKNLSTNEKALKDLSENIDELNRRMDEYLRDIKAKNDHYRTC